LARKAQKKEDKEFYQPFKFVGQFGVMQEPNGFYYMRARYYDPKVGRFISEDPIGFEGGDVNLYNYASNNPLLLIDPLGLCSTESSWHGFLKGTVYWSNVAGLSSLLLPPPADVTGPLVFGVINLAAAGLDNYLFSKHPGVDNFLEGESIVLKQVLTPPTEPAKSVYGVLIDIGLEAFKNARDSR